MPKIACISKLFITLSERQDGVILTRISGMSGYVSKLGCACPAART